MGSADSVMHFSSLAFFTQCSEIRFVLTDSCENFTQKKKSMTHAIKAPLVGGDPILPHHGHLVAGVDFLLHNFCDVLFLTEWSVWCWGRFFGIR